MLGEVVIAGVKDGDKDGTTKRNNGEMKACLQRVEFGESKRVKNEKGERETN